MNDTIEYLKKYQVIIFLLIAVSLAVFIRIQPEFLPLTDQWSGDSVAKFNEQIINQQLLEKYPTLPYEARYKEFREEYQKLIAEDRVYMPAEYGYKQGKYEDAIKIYSQYYKSQLENEYGNTYLLAIDSYYYARFARNILENGHVGDIMIDGVPMETLKLSPSIRPADKNWHSYVNAYTFKISEWFGNKDPMKAYFYVPVIISALSIIPCFFILKRHSGPVGALAGSAVLATHSAFVSRTVAGFSDTDGYNVLFPLMILWMFLISLRAESTTKKISFGILGGALVALYSNFWSGWWYIFDFILAAYGIFFILKVANNLKQRANIFYELTPSLIKTMIPFFVSAFVFYGFRFKSFFGVFLQYPLSVITIKDVATKTIWPNVLTTVAELNAVPMSQIVAQSGGPLLFITAVLGILTYILMRLKYNPYPDLQNTLFHKNYLFFPIILSIFLLGSMYASTKGVRFILIMVPALSLGVGTMFGLAYNFLSEKFASALNVKESFVQFMIIVMMIVVLISPVANGYNQARFGIPSMNDGWFSSLNKINMQADEDAIITSWWDFGHWFKYYGNRGTTFDGASQSVPQSHWVGRLLQTGNETEAINILRMLDCGGNEMYNEINKRYGDYESILITKEVIHMNASAAYDYLKDLDFETNEIINITKKGLCEPPQAFVIASDDMVIKSGVWGHFGLWDFKKSKMINEVRGLNHNNGVKTLQSDFNMTYSEATTTYNTIITTDINNWIAPWPGYLTGLTQCSIVDEYFAECNLNINGGILPLIYDIRELNEKKVHVKGQENLWPDKFVSMIDGNFTVEDYENTNQIGFGVLITKIADKYYFMVADELLIDSVFTRMFFLQGEGLECFDSFSTEQQMTGGMIYIYEADWDCLS